MNSQDPLRVHYKGCHASYEGDHPCTCNEIDNHDFKCWRLFSHTAICNCSLNDGSTSYVSKEGGDV